MKTYRRMLHLCSLMYMMYHILEPTHISASENSSIHICCAISVMSSTSLLSLVSQWLPLDLRERWKKKKKDTPGRKQITQVWAQKYLPCVKTRFHQDVERGRTFPQSCLPLCSTFSSPLHLPCLLTTSRAVLSLSITSDLSPLWARSCLHACAHASQCVKTRTRMRLRHYLL